MAKRDIRFTARIPSNIVEDVEILADTLNVSKNDVVKMLLHAGLKVLKIDY